MVSKKKKKETQIIEFNPSSRKLLELDKEEIDYIETAIKEAGMKFAEEKEKELMIILMGLIRKRLREDPSFAQKLRELLELDKYFETFIKPKKKIRRIRVGTEYYDYELGC